MPMHPTSASWVCQVIELSMNGKGSGEGKGSACLICFIQKRALLVPEAARGLCYRYGSSRRAGWKLCGEGIWSALESQSISGLKMQEARQTCSIIGLRSHLLSDSSQWATKLEKEVGDRLPGHTQMDLLRILDLLRLALATLRFLSLEIIDAMQCFRGKKQHFRQNTQTHIRNTKNRVSGRTNWRFCVWWTQMEKVKVERTNENKN